jgi:hypothetical protein
VYSHGEGISYSQPEMRQAGQPVYAEEGNYVNVAAIRNYNHTVYSNTVFTHDGYYALKGGGGGMGGGGGGGGGLERGGGNLAASAHATYSSPELNVPPPDLPHHHHHHPFPGSEGLLNTDYHFRPPPPYPRASTSTPDLVTQTTGQLGPPTG